MVAKNKAPSTAAKGTLQVAVLQHSPAGAASLTNAFVTALSNYTQGQLAVKNKKQITQQVAYIANLEKAIANLPKKLKTPTATTTPTTAKPPIVIKKKKVVVKKPKSSMAAVAPKAALASFTFPAAQVVAPATGTSTPVVLVDTTSSSTTPSTNLTPATEPGATATGSGSTAAGSTTQTTLSLNNRAVQTENRALANQLAAATAHLAKLEADGVSPTGLRVVTVAHRQDAVLVSTSSLLSNVWFRALLGLLIGALVGVVATWVLDAFDRRLRTSKRAEEVFGLPVIVEIPAPRAKSVSPIPVVDVVADPYSPASEAYRRLHVALLTAPPVTWVKRGYGLQDEFFELPPRQPQEVLVGAGVAGDPARAETGQTRLPVPTGTSGLAALHRKRFSILVTSPTDEPSRSLVIVNLAAVFAEAGDRVLVATTGGMRTGFDGNGQVPSAWESPTAPMSASDVVANARPSQIPGVSSLALGQLFPNPSRLALNAPAVVEAARDVVDVVLLEAPILSTQDGAALLPAADLVVVVCEAWHTTVSDGLRSQRLLAQFRPPVLGLVMTNMQVDHPSLSGTATPI